MEGVRHSVSQQPCLANQPERRAKSEFSTSKRDFRAAIPLPAAARDRSLRLSPVAFPPRECLAHMHALPTCLAASVRVLRCVALRPGLV